MRNKLICTITSQVFRSAMLCAAKNDIRYYLNGVYISFKDKCIVATNGHYLYKSDINIEAETEGIKKLFNNQDGFILESIKIPANVESINIYRMPDENDNVDNIIVGNHQFLITTILKNGTSGPQFIAKCIDGRFPNFNQVMPAYKYNSNDNGSTRFSFNAEFLAMTMKIFGKVPVVITQENNKSAAVITSDKPEQGIFLVMPCRID